jgi:HD superfamily phosphohydrolase
MKIINDPVYGFIDIPEGLVLSILDHPWFQRLRRIKQGGFSNLVYPGSTHTRFHHALGSFHLAVMTVNLLRKKGVTISTEEEEALRLALLLHDIGHGPYSHTLEKQILPLSHEDIGFQFMLLLNKKYDGKLDMVLSMYKRSYHRDFFNQLISGQLDLDRMDYLARDSFFTGVAEGVIGYDRIIHMLNVEKNRLVVEEKGLTSIEKFLVARKLMYAQVYHHKMVLASEHMLGIFINRIKTLISENTLDLDFPIISLLSRTYKEGYQLQHDDLIQFSMLDDSDVIQLLKACINHDDPVLRLIADGLINRRLFKLIFDINHNRSDLSPELRLHIEQLPKSLVINGEIDKVVYTDNEDEEIEILLKVEKVVPLSSVNPGIVEKHFIKSYLCYAPRTRQSKTINQ